jgi:hypothetical protein
LVDLLIPTDPAEMSDLDNLETMHKEHDTPRHLSSDSRKTASVSPDQGGDDEVEAINGKEAE